MAERGAAGVDAGPGRDGDQGVFARAAGQPGPVAAPPLSRTARWNTPPPPTRPAPGRLGGTPGRPAARPAAPADHEAPARSAAAGFLRFLQVLLSVLVLITVPLVAMVLAYGYGNGDAIEDDARHVLEDIARYLGLWLK